MVDLFEEVEEQLRAEQYKRLGLKLLPWAVGLVLGALVIGGGYVAYSMWQSNRTAHAVESYQKALDTLQHGDSEGAFAAFADVAQKGTPIMKSFALTQQAAIRQSQGRDNDAATLFTKAADAAPKTPEGQVFADLARLKSARTLLDTAPYADIEARLKPLTDHKRPFSTAAREDLAWAKLRAGKIPEARNDFVALTTAVDAPPALTERAQGAIQLIDSGAAAELPKLVAAIRALPAPAQNSGISPEMLQQLMSQQGQGGAPAGQGAPAQ